MGLDVADPRPLLAPRVESADDRLVELALFVESLPAGWYDERQWVSCLLGWGIEIYGRRFGVRHIQDGGPLPWVAAQTLFACTLAEYEILFHPKYAPRTAAQAASDVRRVLERRRRP